MSPEFSSFNPKSSDPPPGTLPCTGLAESCRPKSPQFHDLKAHHLFEIARFYGRRAAQGGGNIILECCLARAGIVLTEVTDVKISHQALREQGLISNGAPNFCCIVSPP